MPELVLQARGLAKSFASPAGPLPVLTDVSLEVFAGESVSIRGSSGSGKTTLLQQLGGLDQPDAGEVRILAPGAGLVAPRTSLGRGVGFVFQNYQLMPELTALENVALAARIAGTPTLPRTRPPAPCSRRSVWAPASNTCRRNFPAANASASPSPAPW